ncbi:MAG: AAA family ATPase [Firmicutes bacterium]|nr:AAA family ATPase [Bacillota bacterium]
MKQTPENLLASYVDALRPIIYINHFDFEAVDDMIEKISDGARIVEFNNALGCINFKNKSPMSECTLIEFLKHCIEDDARADFIDSAVKPNTFIVLKDVHDSLNDKQVIALLRRIAEFSINNPVFRTGPVFIVASKTVIPVELENYITIFDIPLPGNEEVVEAIYKFIEDVNISVSDEVIDDLALSFKGLNKFQIRQILTLAYQDGGYIDAGDKQLILQEKEQFIKKSGMLEIVNFKETIQDIGGLETLKEWLDKKAKIFQNLDKAIKFGVDIPKGIMIVGMPGCGKSLTAKATADLFQLPLVRLDIGRLLGKYVGESEENMRKALKLSEAISPCVLWIDEIEKAFAGIGGAGGGNDVTTRLFGQFLTWMQEKESTVFIVATANDISNLPGEFLRKGRFDELFFVDLPNREERRKIFEIHLKKRRKWNKDLDIFSLVEKTQGYNGADIEAVIKETIELAFIEERNILTTDDIKAVIEDTKSISETLKTKIQKIRDTVANMDIKTASKPDPTETKK